MDCISIIYNFIILIQLYNNTHVAYYYLQSKNKHIIQFYYVIISYFNISFLVINSIVIFNLNEIQKYI